VTTRDTKPDAHDITCRQAVALMTEYLDGVLGPDDRALIQAAIDLAAAESVTTILVATAAADIGNLRFYQRQGFRMRSVERDAFTPATGYPPGLLIDGIELRDRVWLDRTVLVHACP
jgi:hypothetical protein